MSANDDWKEEYRELSEDYRHLVVMGWQASIAVLIGYFVAIGSVMLTKNPTIISVTFYFAGVITPIMAYKTPKWIWRSKTPWML